MTGKTFSEQQHTHTYTHTLVYGEKQNVYKMCHLAFISQLCCIVVYSRRPRPSVLHAHRFSEGESRHPVFGRICSGMDVCVAIRCDDEEKARRESCCGVCILE